MGWLCFNDAFLSVVNHHDDRDQLVVRARRREHLTNVFGKDAQITVTPERDYKYRVIAERKKVAEIVAARINQIDYGNFKDSVGLMASMHSMSGSGACTISFNDKQILAAHRFIAGLKVSCNGPFADAN
jgi:cellobiose-specific phosphotransferase system component IIB